MDVRYTFQGELTDAEKTTIKEVVDYNIAHKMEGYIAKIKKSSDTAIVCTVVIDKKGRNNVNGVFTLSAPGAGSIRYEREGFKSMRDLVAHAFDHFKEKLASA